MTMNDGTTGAGYIPFTPIEVSTPKEHEPMNPTNMNEAEMREFFAKVASAVVNASDLAKQVAEINARVASLESLCIAHLQTIEALREQVRETANERNEARAEAITATNERDVARDEYNRVRLVVRDREGEIVNLLARITELEAAAKGAQQTISDLQHTVYNVREELRDAREERDILKGSLDRTREAAAEERNTLIAQNEAHKAHIKAEAALLEHYETQLDQVRKAIA